VKDTTQSISRKERKKISPVQVVLKIKNKIGRGFKCEVVTLSCGDRSSVPVTGRLEKSLGSGLGLI